MINQDRLWSTWSEIEVRKAGRPILLYGRSQDWVHKAVKQLVVAPVGIVDRDPAYADTTYMGLQVFPIEACPDPHQHFFIITAGEFDGIVENLLSLGLTPGQDFVCSPDFRDYRRILELKTAVHQIVVSCSDYRDSKRARSSEVGGGLYMLDVGSGELAPIYPGSTRQMVRLTDGGIATVDYVDHKLLLFSADLSLQHEYDLEHPNVCGVAFSAERNLLYIANATRDTISTFDIREGRLTSEFPFGSGVAGAGAHHLNDLTVFGDRLYASFFSWAGAFKQGVFDGGVASWDLDRIEEPPQSLVSGLWKPHSPFFIENELHVLDSMSGEVRTGGPQPRARLQGFIRGADVRGGALVVGHSEDMYVTERLGRDGNTVATVAGVNIMKAQPGFIEISRFISTPTLMNIHDVMIWGDSDV